MPQPTTSPNQSKGCLARMMRKVVIFLMGIIALWGIWMGIWYLRAPVVMTHLFTYPYRKPITTSRWYKPRERVAGRHRTPLPDASKAKRRAIARVMTPAAQYAKAHNSSALLVVHKGQIAFERYWLSTNQDTHTNSMSMAKTLVAMLIGMAIQDRWLQSEQQVAADFLPTWRTDQRKHIKIVDLLQMHSGLRGDGKRWQIKSDITQLYFSPDIVKHLWTIPAVQPPGTDFLYKDADSQALGVLLERATKMRFATYLSRKLWQPIEAKDGFVWLDRKGGMARTSCCMFATARDWARIGIVLMQRGRWKGKQLVSAAWVQKMLTPSPTEDDYGYQIWLNSQTGLRRYDRTEPFLAPDLFYLDGIFRQRVYVIPSFDLVVVRLGERSRKWDDARLPNAAIKAIVSWQNR